MTVAPSAVVESLGWAATAVFAGSYLFARAETLVRAQMLGALMWAVYGVLVRAPPVVAANVLVLAAAAWKARRARRGNGAAVRRDGTNGPAAVGAEAEALDLSRDDAPTLVAGQRALAWLQERRSLSR